MTPPKEKIIRIIVADDHALLRRGFAEVISEHADMCVIAEAGNGNDLLKIIRELEPDVVVMDVGMPEKSGWDVIMELKIERPNLPVIILSILPEEDYAVKFYKAGASGYVEKKAAPELLVEAIRKVSQGRKFVSQALMEKMAMELSEQSDKLPHELLSPREFQIFFQIASGKTTKEIASDLSLSVPSINTYRLRIFEKLGMKNISQLTHYAFQHKLIE
jgi:DNA-binding NarL/FixJ family response regulator